MATYEYLCDHCGPFDVKLTIGTAPRTHGCPSCTNAARRLYSAPGLKTTSTNASAALREREEQAREAPAVVSEVPLRARPERRPHPALSRLPRP
ncbi:MULTISPECIES: FmdB family zinc ribbon protein [unclassified Streptomyces]|uniref:FmdB family zinc ribbon protein n=1 Tax=unclassified Streptomyces TaxID=2593676 RepID=UPI0033E2232A